MTQDASGSKLPRTRTMVGHRYFVSPTRSTTGATCFWIKLPSGGLDELGAALGRFPDVLKSRLLGSEERVAGYELVGDGFIATLVKERRARRLATLLVETTDQPPPFDGGTRLLWHYLLGDPPGSVAPEDAHAYGHPARSTEGVPTAATTVEPSSVVVGAVRVQQAGPLVNVVIGDSGPEGRVALDADATAELSDVLGTFAMRAIRYADAVNERASKPESDWQYVAPEKMQFKTSIEGHRIGDLKLSQHGAAVRLEILDQPGTYAELRGDDAYRLSEPLLGLAVRAMRASRS